MDAGLISKRYAKTLLKYSSQEGVEERVFADAQALAEALKTDAAIPACVEGLCPQMQNFLSLVIRNERVEHLQLILCSFIHLYRKEHGITQARLVSASNNPDLEKKVLALLERRGFTKVDFESHVEPGLIGGFILYIDDLRLDASLKRELETIRKEFEEKNRKLL